MFPLRNKEIGGYQFGDKTFYNTSHSGTDYKASYDDYQIPFNGYVRSGYGVEGGYFLELTRDNGDVITARHLSKIYLKSGYRVEGEFAAITGNSGIFTTNPHLHLEVKVKQKLIDPETYKWERVFKINLVQQGGVWETMPDKFKEIRHRVYETGSNYHLDIHIDHTPVNFPDIPFVDYGNGNKGVDQNWLKENLTRFGEGYHAVCFLIPSRLTPPHGVVFGFSDGDGKPVYISQVFADENEIISGGFGMMNLFVNTFIHENCGHILKLVDGDYDCTHSYLSNATSPSIFNLNQFMLTYNYKNLDKFL
jgi:hypothetical protein